MSNELKQAFMYYAFLTGGFAIGVIVYCLDGSPHQSWVSFMLMGLGGFVCARVAVR